MNVLIGSVTIRKAHYLQSRGAELNSILKDLCHLHNFSFIDNGNITVDNLSDGTHLDNNGTALLANNYLNSLWDTHNT